MNMAGVSKSYLKDTSFSFLFLLGEKVLKFYWFDAYEDRFKQPGKV